MSFCSRCGNALKEGAIFCHLCGSRGEEISKPHKETKKGTDWGAVARGIFILGIIIFVIYVIILSMIPESKFDSVSACKRYCIQTGDSYCNYIKDVSCICKQWTHSDATKLTSSIKEEINILERSCKDPLFAECEDWCSPIRHCIDYEVTSGGDLRIKCEGDTRYMACSIRGNVKVCL